jgi:hypothetical protein
MKTNNSRGIPPPAHKFPKAEEKSGNKTAVAFPTSPRPHGDRIGLDEDTRVHFSEERDPNDGQTS